MGRPTHIFTQTLAFQAPTGVNNDGDPVYGDVQTIACRYVRKRELGRTPSGIVPVESTVIMSEVEIPEGSLVWLDGTGAGDRKQARVPQQRTFAKKPFEAYTLYETRL